MDTTQDILEVQWHEVKAEVKRRWRKLTDDDIATMSGKQDELTYALQRRYGYGKAQAQMEIDHWLSGRAS